MMSKQDRLDTRTEIREGCQPLACSPFVKGRHNVVADKRHGIAPLSIVFDICKSYGEVELAARAFAHTLLCRLYGRHPAVLLGRRGTGHWKSWSGGLVSPSKTSPGRGWRVEINHSAEKQIQKLDRSAQGPIVRFLRGRVQAADNPRQWGKPLHGDKGGLWRYRVGDYQLICDIQDERITVLVVSVGHHKDVYR